MFTQLTIDHQNPEITLSFSQLNCLKFRAEVFYLPRDFQWGLWSDSVLIVYCYPLLALYSSLSLGSPPLSALPLLSSPLFSPPCPAPASNGLNRLASCQSRGLLWLCHKSARKNRNHLFRPGPERGWGCKYMSLALAPSPACAHGTTKPRGFCSPTQPQHELKPTFRLPVMNLY